MLEKVSFINYSDTELFIEFLEDCIAKLYIVRERFKKEDEKNDEL